MSLDIVLFLSSLKTGSKRREKMRGVGKGKKTLGKEERDWEDVKKVRERAAGNMCPGILL